MEQRRVVVPQCEREARRSTRGRRSRWCRSSARAAPASARRSPPAGCRPARARSPRSRVAPDASEAPGSSALRASRRCSSSGSGSAARSAASGRDGLLELGAPLARAASAFIRARCTNTACAASAFAASPPQDCSADCWSARPYENESGHGPPSRLIAFRFSVACDLRLAAGEEDDPGYRGRNDAQEAVDRRARRSARATPARGSPCRR